MNEPETLLDFLDLKIFGDDAFEETLNCIGCCFLLVPTVTTSLTPLYSDFALQTTYTLICISSHRYLCRLARFLRLHRARSS